MTFNSICTSTHLCNFLNYIWGINRMTCVLQYWVLVVFKQELHHICRRMVFWQIAFWQISIRLAFLTWTFQIEITNHKGSNSLPLSISQFTVSEKGADKILSISLLYHLFPYLIVSLLPRYCTKWFLHPQNL